MSISERPSPSPPAQGYAVCPPGLPPYNKRDPGSAFGPPKRCEAGCFHGRFWVASRKPPDSFYNAVGEWRDCKDCDGNGYVNAVRMP